MRIEKLSPTVTLYCGDSAAILPTLGFFDAIVTDPPYGINIAAKGQIGSGGKDAKGQTIAVREYAKSDWDARPIDAAMIKLIRGMSTHQIIFGGNYFELPPTSCWLIWDKKNGTNAFADCEMAWTNLPKAVRLIEWLWNGFSRKGQEERGFHPTQKPVGVMRWCLSHLPPGAKTICDPFMGSGTTGIACVREGKRFIGIERDETFFDAACQRIAEAIERPDMLAPPPEPAAEQVALFAEG